MNSRNYILNVYINHYVPPKFSYLNWLKHFVILRCNKDYLRSFARLIKHGTRGNQPWKKDLLTRPRSKDFKNRNAYLLTVIDELNSLNVKKIQINVISNTFEAENDLTSLRILKNVKFHVFPNYKEFNPIRNSPWILEKANSPWFMAWEHKNILAKDVKNVSSDKVLFLYIDNDIRFTQQSLDYWLEHRQTLMEKNLIPGFTLVEFSMPRQCWVSLSTFQGKPFAIEDLPRVTIKSNTYVNLPNPYSACYLLDLDLAEEYINSEAFIESKSRNLTWWDIGARAAMGLTFVNIPKNFSSRLVVPIRQLNKDYLILEDAKLHHMPNIYSRTREIGDNLMNITKLIVSKEVL